MAKIRVQFTYEPDAGEWDPDSPEGLTAEARERVVDWLEGSELRADTVEFTREDDRKQPAVHEGAGVLSRQYYGGDGGPVCDASHAGEATWNGDNQYACVNYHGNWQWVWIDSR